MTIFNTFLFAKTTKDSFQLSISKTVNVYFTALIFMIELNFLPKHWQKVEDRATQKGCFCTGISSKNLNKCQKNVENTIHCFFCLLNSSVKFLHNKKLVKLKKKTMVQKTVSFLKTYFGSKNTFKRQNFCETSSHQLFKNNLMFLNFSKFLRRLIFSSFLRVLEQEK